MSWRRQRYRLKALGLIDYPLSGWYAVKIKILKDEKLNHHDWNIMSQYLEKEGWKHQHLFMRGSRWTKDEEVIIFQNGGPLYNGVKTTYKQLILDQAI